MRSKRVHKSLRKKFSKKYNRSLRSKNKGGASNKKYITWLDTGGEMNTSSITEENTDEEAINEFCEMLGRIKARGTLLLGITHVSGIEEFFFSKEIQPKSLYEHLSSINLNGVKTINNDCFIHCSSLTEIILPDVETILHGGFEDCTSLKTAYIPKVSVIQSRAFLGCRSLREIEANQAIEIGVSAFDNCYYLKVIILPNISILGIDAFSRACAAHESIELTIPDHLKGKLPKVLITKAMKGKAYRKKQRRKEKEQRQKEIEKENQEAYERGIEKHREAEERKKKKKQEEEQEEEEAAKRHAEELLKASQEAREAYKSGYPDPDEVGPGPAPMFLKKQNEKQERSKRLTPTEESLKGALKLSSSIFDKYTGTNTSGFFN